MNPENIMWTFVVLCCIGLLFTIKIVVANLWALHQQVQGIKEDESRGQLQHTIEQSPQMLVPNVSSAMQSKADPKKLAALKSNFKK